MLKTRIWSLVTAGLTALVLSACGGGAEFGGTTGGTLGGTTGGTTGDPGPTVSKLILLASSPQLSSDASDVSAGVTLTAILRDANNNVVPGVTVVFATEDSAEINVVNPAVTDENGRTSAVLTTGGDPENRSIDVTASGGGLSSSVTVQVVGTELSISGISSTQIGVPTDYTVLLTDASGSGIPNETISVSTEPENTIEAASLVTDASGQVAVTLTATRADSSLSASALGLTSSVDIVVSTDQFSLEVLEDPQNPGCELIPLGGGETDSPARIIAELDIGLDCPIQARWLQGGQPVVNALIRFAATRGEVADSNTQRTDGGGAARTTIRSLQPGESVITASSPDSTQPSIARRVEFVATTPAKIEVQANPANVPPNQSSEITAIVRDANNNLVKDVTVEFSLSDPTAGTLSTPTAVTDSRGLARVTYNSTSQASATEGITVRGKVRDADIEDTALLTVGGRAADITIGTGSEIIIKDESTYELPFTVIVTDSAGNPVPDAEFTLTLFATRYFKGTFGGLVACSNEDLNRNDILDPDDFDENNNGALEPGRVAALPATIALDQDGAGQFAVTYAKSFGVFVEIEITGVATVSGTETTEKRKFVLPIAEEDEDNLPGVSPFGTVLDCTSPD